MCGRPLVWVRSLKTYFNSWSANALLGRVFFFFFCCSCVHPMQCGGWFTGFASHWFMRRDKIWSHDCLHLKYFCVEGGPCYSAQVFICAGLFPSACVPRSPDLCIQTLMSKSLLLTAWEGGSWVEWPCPSFKSAFLQALLALPFITCLPVTSSTIDCISF